MADVTTFMCRLAITFESLERVEPQGIVLPFCVTELLFFTSLFRCSFLVPSWGKNSKDRSMDGNIMRGVLFVFCTNIAGFHC